MMKLISRIALSITICLVALVCLAAPAGPDPATPAAQDTRTEALRNGAESLYADGSYALAREKYEQLSKMNLSDAQRRWVTFRLADTGWRARAATKQQDDTKDRHYVMALQTLINDTRRPEDRDQVWALAQESLGDYYWTRERSHSFHQAQNYYHQALDFWAGSADIDTARRRYLDIVWRMAEPTWARHHTWHDPRTLPQNIAANAVEIAETDEDRARAHYLYAVSLIQNSGSYNARLRAIEQFEAAIAFGANNPWYDDALYRFAEYLNRYGQPELDDHGNWTSEPDHVGALALYRRLTSEFSKSQTRFYDHARNQIREITREHLTANVSNIFLPDSEITFNVQSRNLSTIDLNLFPVDLTTAMSMPQTTENPLHDWLARINPTGQPLRTWTLDTQDTGEHRWMNRAEKLDEPLPVGAYLLTARGGNQSARELILVTDATITVKTWHDQMLGWMTDAMTGEPIAEADVQVWQYAYTGRNSDWRLNEVSNSTDTDGLASFTVPRQPNHAQFAYLLAAKSGDRQAFALQQWHDRSADTNVQWKVYATTDRPAYRPDETVKWKITARTRRAGQYATPSDTDVNYEIHGPRGKIHDGTATLNAFGSAWGEFDLTSEHALGEYSIHLKKSDNNWIGQAQLFRIEEYKLPEFTVAVQTPKDDEGRAKVFRVGESVQATIAADYYFGGPVANASVDVVVYQKPYWQRWHWPREYSWYYDDQQQHHYRHWYGHGQQVSTQTVRTDDEGRATITFDTPEDQGQDYEYTIEARVTDASRREISGSGTVRVTRQSYAVHARPESKLYSPGDTVAIDFKAIDPNQNPRQVEGQVEVYRQQWMEIWISPDGDEVTGDALRRAKRECTVFPPAPQRGRPGWTLKYRGYEKTLITEGIIETDADGEATFEFAAPEAGYYTVHWSSRDERYGAIRANTGVYIADENTTILGYHHAGVEIIVDQDTYMPGDEASVILSADGPNRWVLFTVEAEDLYHHRVVHIRGDAQLIHVPITDANTPNVNFHAAMFHSGRMHVDTESIVVPPVERFLTVDVELPSDAYQPGDEAQIAITTRDHFGNAVAAELSLATIDASVFYIQSDYAGDPRQFFFNDRQGHAVWMNSTMNWRQYAKFITEDKDGRDDAVGGGLREEFRQGEGLNARGRAGGGAFGGSAIFGDPEAPTAASAQKSVAGREVMEMAMEADAVGGAPPAPPTDNNAADPNIVVRSDFRSTLAWLPDLKTGDDGRATVDVTFADSLTQWKTTARAITTGNQVGIGDLTVRTRMPLIARLQAPRFFVVGDEVTISGVFNNNTDEPMTIRPDLLATGLTLIERLYDGQALSQDTITISANRDARVDWTARVESPGEAKIKLTGISTDVVQIADAMEKTYPIHEHGITRYIAQSGKVRADDLTINLDIPAARKPESTKLNITVTSSMAVTMLDALPYLVDYPYGCTEQTMSRFLPAVITAKTLTDLNLDPEDAMQRIFTSGFGGIERDHLDKTHPNHNAKRDHLAKLDQITQQGLTRLYDFQHSDGGWGWWKKGDSDHWMSAYVVWGLALCDDADRDVKQDVLRRGVKYLRNNLVEAERQPELQAWMLHALAAAHHMRNAKHLAESEQVAIDNLWTNRDQLNAYGKSLLALALHSYDEHPDRQSTLIDNLRNGVYEDNTPDTSILLGTDQQSSPAVIGTAHWGADGTWYRWHDSPVETTTFALRALLAIDPDNDLIEPVTNWLVKNRRGAQWSNTRDTAMTVLALNDYLNVSGELEADFEFDLIVNGRTVTTETITAAQALRAPSTWSIEPEYIRDGVNTIRIVRRNGAGNLYFAAAAEFFSLEDPVPASGNEIFVRRDYYKLVPRETLLKGVVYDRARLTDGDYITSGERVETVLTIEAKNDYEYLLFEDLKPAGFESTQVRSGESLSARRLRESAIDRKFGGDGVPVEDRRQPGVRPSSDYTGAQRWVHQELRDRQTALFVDKLPEGTWEIRYDYRAEVPGYFHALPVMAEAMYVPEIRANSDEIRLTVQDR